MSLHTTELQEIFNPTIWDLHPQMFPDCEEMGMRVACALYAENVNPPLMRKDMICYRGYDAQRARREKERRAPRKQ